VCVCMRAYVVEVEATLKVCVCVCEGVCVCARMRAYVVEVEATLKVCHKMFSRIGASEADILCVCVCVCVCVQSVEKNHEGAKRIETRTAELPKVSHLPDHAWRAHRDFECSPFKIKPSHTFKH
jgi:hypothetical protein